LCLIGIDIGTQSVRALAFDLRGGKLASASRPTPMTVTESGGEYDPDTIFNVVLATLAEVGAALRGRPVAGMAAASIGESCVLIDESGHSLAPSIAWFDGRTEPQARAIGARIHPGRIFAITGHGVDATPTLFKLAWMREHWPQVFARTRGTLMMADWIAFRLSGEAATDPTLASRTLYFSIHERRWSDELLAEVGMDSRVPAPIAASGSGLGPVRPEILAETGIAGRPIVAVGGHDHLVGAFAAGFTGPGTMLDSLGTAEALLLGTPRPLADPEVLRRGYSQGALAAGRAMSFLHGGIHSAGGSIEWCRRIVGDVAQATLIAEAGMVPAGSGGVLFLPHFITSPPPHPGANARGAFIGLGPSTTRGALYRAVLEGLAMQARLMSDGMTGLPNVEPPAAIRVIGGGSRNALFLQIKANAFARPLTVIDEPEATALGAALLGGVAGGVYANLDEGLAALERHEHLVEPDADAARYEMLRTAVFAPVQGALKTVNEAIALSQGRISA
jgi:xylulokinase